MEQLTNVQAIKRYFEADPRIGKLSLQELKRLGPEGRAELGALAAKELGAEIKPAIV